MPQMPCVQHATTGAKAGRWQMPSGMHHFGFMTFSNSFGYSPPALKNHGQQLSFKIHMCVMKLDGRVNMDAQYRAMKFS
jgi:hypothetical protein